MPLIRKIIKFGKTSKGVILPKSWFEYYVSETETEIKYVTLKMNDANYTVTIQPFLKQK